MSPNQKDFIAKLAIANLIVYLIFAFIWFQPSLPPLPNLIGRPTAVPPQPTYALSKPVIILPASASVPSPVPTRTSQPAVRKVTPLVPQAALTSPTGSSPSNLMTPMDSWRTIDPGARVWYKIGSGGFHISVFLEAKPLDGMTMDVYAPGQLEQPIGRGTLERATNRLVWAGGHWQSEGDWLARLTNGNSTSVQYKLTSTAKDISNKSCYSYWEYIGDQPVYWTRCD
jgi:hypothetical protein